MPAAKKRAKKSTEGGAKKAPRKRKAAAEAGSRGLSAAEVGDVEASAPLQALASAIEADEGSVLAQYRDPLGGHATILAVLPIDRVEPTPFQRDLSDTHVARLSEVIDKLDRFLDPIVVVRHEASGRYWTPNGNHRLHAMKGLGARSIVALVVPDADVAYKILALNTEKAHNVREKALEVIRMARSLAELDDRHESAYALEFEEPLLVTLGACYEQRGRFSGSAYSPVLKRVEAFLDVPLAEAIEIRQARAGKLLQLDDAVGEAVAALKQRGMDSPYLKQFVVARCSPLRGKRGEAGGDWDEAIDAMIEAAGRFDASRVDAGQLARTGGGPSE